RILLSIPLLAAFAPAAFAQLVPDYAAPNREFGATMVVTSDAGWRDKWNTPSDSLPRFETTDRVRTGQTVHVLTFVTNVGVYRDGTADVVCRVTAKRPDGTTSIDQPDVACLRGELGQTSDRVYLTSAVLRFAPAPDDPRGDWTFTVALTDRVQNATFTVSKTFAVTD
ncbi:MAG TPA: hypothetical protein VJ724_00260, partial [Tahibacter sp.]|nr:hypothetical protein [Tahibacter sp.]